MPLPTLRSSLLPALTLSVIALGCGSSRQLQSVTITPAAADARNFPNGQVSFSATGTFSRPPSPQPLTSSDVSWCVGVIQGTCAGNINPGASVDSSGVARCVPGFAGTALIMAGKARASMMPDGGSQMTIYGSAQLTCP